MADSVHITDFIARFYILCVQRWSMLAQPAEASIYLMDCWTKDGPDCCVFIDSARVPECD